MKKDMSILLWFAGFLALSTALPSFDLKFQSQKQAKEEKILEKIMKSLNTPKPLSRHQPVDHVWKWSIVPNNRLMSFKWSDCGNSSSKILFKDFKLTPDPVVLPGSIKVSAGIEIKEDILNSLSAEVKLTKIIDSIHFNIPCIGDVGSCHYNNLCSRLSRITKCPDVMMKNNIPCKCPFKKGSYFLPLTEFKINSDPIPSGDYTLKVDLNYEGKFIGCLSLAASFADKSSNVH